MTTKFVFLILPDIHILDLAGPDQAIHEAIDFGADFEIIHCGLNEKVVTTSGLPFGRIPHFSKIKLNAGDFVIIPGSAFSYLSSTHFYQQTKLFEWIRLNFQKGVNMCSICLGAFVLAESGLLNGLTCTTHFKKTKELQRLYPALNVVENCLFTDWNGIYTSAGIASGIDLTLYILEKIEGSYLANKVARELVVYNRRAGNSSQESELLKFRNHIHTGIHNVQDFIIEHLSQKTPLWQLAEIANMSERNFTRIFKKETGTTVNAFINMLRKEKIKEYMKHPDLSKIEIANKVGLQSDKQVRRLLQAELR